MYYYPGCPIGTEFDFEEGPKSLEHWVRTGTAFNNQPTFGDNPTARSREPSSCIGNYWIGGYENRTNPQVTAGNHGSDVYIGTLTSPEFVITGKMVNFLVGGGCDISLVSVNLVVAGNFVRRATGKCKETMSRVSWNVEEFKGMKAKLQLVDHTDGKWGHINFDDFRGDIAYCKGNWNGLVIFVIHPADEQ